VLFNKFADSFCSEHHDSDGYHDGDNHDREVAGKADCGDDGVEREDDVEQGYLQHCEKEVACAAGFGVLFNSLKALMDFMGAFGQQKESSRNKNKVPS